MNITIVVQGNQTQFESGNRYAITEPFSAGCAVRLYEGDYLVHDFDAADKAEAGLWMTWWCQRAI